jgi:hypothetical protein
MARFHTIAFAVIAVSGLGGVAAFGCSSSGNVSLGKNDDGLTVCDRSACGPAPGIASTICADGSTGGFTGRCVKATGATTCGWEIRSCSDPTCTPPAPTTCPDGTVTVAGCTKDPSTGTCTCAGTACPTPVCSSTECGPEPYGMPNYKCADGSIGGPVCDASSGKCGWHIRSCPTGDDAGTGDSISIDAISTDGPVGDGGACFDPTGTIPYMYRRCGTDAECSTAKHQTNCCGDKTVTGINAAESGAFATCESAWDAHFPGCGCAEGPDKTDDGLVITDPTKVVVHCNSPTGGATGTCETTLGP